MKFTPYTFAAADFLSITLSLVGGLLLFLALRWASSGFFDLILSLLGGVKNFEEPDTDATFEGSPDLSETGIAAEIAHLPPGTQLVEVDTAGMLTPPQHVLVHEYRWTGSAIEHVRSVPLHEFDFLIPGSAPHPSLSELRRAASHAASHPEALAGREDFLSSHRPLRPTDHVRL